MSVCIHSFIRYCCSKVKHLTDEKRIELRDFRRFKEILKVIWLISFLNPSFCYEADADLRFRDDSSIGREFCSISLLIHLTGVTSISIDPKKNTYFCLGICYHSVFFPN